MSSQRIGNCTPVYPTSCSVPFSTPRDSQTNTHLNDYYKQIEQLDFNRDPVKLTDYLFREILKEAYIVYYSLRNNNVKTRYIGKMVVSGKGMPFPIQALQHILGPVAKLTCYTSEVKNHANLAFLPEEMQKIAFTPKAYGIFEIEIKAERLDANSKDQKLHFPRIADRFIPLNQFEPIKLDSLTPNVENWNKLTRSVINCSSSTSICAFGSQEVTSFKGKVFWSDLAAYSSMSKEKQTILRNNFTETIFKAVLLVIVKNDPSLLKTLSLQELFEVRAFLEQYYFLSALSIVTTAIFEKIIYIDMPIEEFKKSMDYLYAESKFLTLGNTILWILIGTIEDHFHKPDDATKRQVDSLIQKLLYFILTCNEVWFTDQENFLKGCLDLVRCCPRLGTWLKCFADYPYKDNSFANFIETYCVATKDAFLINIICELQQNSLKGLLFQEKMKKEYVPATISNFPEIKMRWIEEVKRGLTAEFRGPVYKELLLKMANDPVELAAIREEIKATLHLSEGALLQNNNRERRASNNAATIMRSHSTPTNGWQSTHKEPPKKVEMEDFELI